MSDWPFLNQHRFTGQASWPVLDIYASNPSLGFNGLFRIPVDGKLIRCIASDGEGWQHVSVSIEGEDKPPTWKIMCLVKDWFWEPQDWVVQFHPARSEYVNFHHGCLHLWRCIDGRETPTPPFYLVGPKSAEAQ